MGGNCARCSPFSPSPIASRDHPGISMTIHDRNAPRVPLKVTTEEDPAGLSGGISKTRGHFNSLDLPRDSG